MGTLKEKLSSLGACQEALDWVGDRSAARAWRECPNGQWMMWLIQKCYDKPTPALHRQLTGLAVAFARPSLKHARPQDLPALRLCLQLAGRVARGYPVVAEELTAARDAARAWAASYAARAASDAAGAASDAAWAASYAARAASDAAGAASDAAGAASYAAGAASDAATARMVRRLWPTMPAYVRAALTPKP
jgi:hypothetical protein